MASVATPAPKLRVGVFADTPRQPRWLVEALAKVSASDYAEIVAIRVGENRGQANVSKQTANRGLSPALWNAYSRLDRMLFAPGPDRCELQEIGPLAGSTRRNEAAEDLDLDVAFTIGDVDDAAIARHARCGAWRYAFGDATSEALAGIPEAIAAQPVTATAIRIRARDGRDRLACESWTRTRAFSPAQSRDNLFAKASDLLARALRELRFAGPRWLDEGTVPAPEPRGDGFPGLLGLARVGGRVAARAAERLLTVGQWSLAFRFAATESWDGGLEGFHRLTPPPDRFWADPFPIQALGRNFIFFEELPFRAGKAHISMVEVDREGRASAPVRVIERDYHLSYPFLVEDGGALYMIPESAGNRTVEAYRCVEFPHRWRFERVLLDDVFLADATPVRVRDRWWMFANGAPEGADINDELNLYSSRALLGEWTPHERNPVKSDVRSSRPAGALFRHAGELHRPAQICAPIYGGGIVVNRVTRLDAGGFAEEEVRRILPAGGAALGLHTINRAGDLSATDAFVRRRRF